MITNVFGEGGSVVAADGPECVGLFRFAFFADYWRFILQIPGQILHQLLPAGLCLDIKHYKGHPSCHFGYYSTEK